MLLPVTFCSEKHVQWVQKSILKMEGKEQNILFIFQGPHLHLVSFSLSTLCNTCYRPDAHDDGKESIFFQYYTTLNCMQSKNGNA